MGSVGDVFEDDKGYMYKVVQSSGTFGVVVERDPPYSPKYRPNNQSRMMRSKLSRMKLVKQVKHG